ncbi:MAG TPA: tetratricopeptide repeat protein, partial [Candidatus Tripitaka californicus]|uniref:tetratricopeptide repeat protein n=1 Tax=Candidatus Tripitaka californicus TaxID=3367616 RepID=UPI00402596B2
SAQGDTGEALKSYQSAITADPNCAGAHLGLALLYNKAGMLEEAMASFKEAVRLDPANPEARKGLGLVYELLGKGREADEEFRVYEALIRKS